MKKPLEKAYLRYDGKEVAGNMRVKFTPKLSSGKLFTSYHVAHELLCYTFNQEEHPEQDRIFHLVFKGGNGRFIVATDCVVNTFYLVSDNDEYSSRIDFYATNGIKAYDSENAYIESRI